MEIKNQIQKMSNDIEGMLNDFEGGITEKEETIVNIIDYIVQRAEATLNNFKRDLMISIENRRKFYLENNRPDNASTLEILYNDIKNDQLLDFMKKDGFPVEAEVIKGDSPSAVANKWRYREFIVSEKTNTDPTVYQFILDRNGVALLFTNEFTNIEGSSILIKREIIEDMVNKLNIAEQATASL